MNSVFRRLLRLAGLEARFAGLRVDLLSLLRSRYLLAIVAGLLVAAAFPPWNVAGLAWIAPGLLLFTALGETSARAFRLGYVGGLAYFLAAFYWLLLIPVTNDILGFQVPIAPMIGWVALSLFFSLYLGLWVWLCWKIFPGRFFTPEKDGRISLESFSSATWIRRTGWAFACAMLWVAMEMVLARVLGGFPWNLAGVSQVQILPLIQVASLTGVYGVSFLLVWVSVALGCAVVALARKPLARREMFGEVALPVAVVGVAMMWGWTRLEPPRQGGETLRMALVQPSIPQTMIWDPAENSYRFDKLIALSREALAGKPDVLVWPEAALPSLDMESYQTVAELVAEHGVWMILGSDYAQRDGDEIKYYNSSFLLDPEGQAAALYSKRRLVMFGEFVPLRRWFPILGYLSPIQGDFTPGDGPVIFSLEGAQAKISPVICFEDVFPHLAREHVELEVDMLLTLTNNGWFGESASHWQHTFNAVFRAIENGVPLVRASNNGITGWIDRFGRLRQYFGKETGDVYAEGYLIVEVPLRRDKTLEAATVYNRYGDWFGWACMGGAGLLLMVRRVGRRKWHPDAERLAKLKAGLGREQAKGFMT